MTHIFLLTSTVRVGKTTALKKIVDMLGKEECGGFYTEEVRNETNRIGFRIVSLDDSSGMISDINSTSEIRVESLSMPGVSYGVNIDIIDGVGVSSIRNAIKDKKYIIIDEIGPMQLYSHEFKVAILEAFASNKPVIGSVVHRPTPWVDELKQRDDISVIELTLENRDTIPGYIVKMLVKGAGEQNQ